MHVDNIPVIEYARDHAVDAVGMLELPSESHTRVTLCSARKSLTDAIEHIDLVLADEREKL